MFQKAILSFTEQKSVKFYRNKSDVAWTLYIIWPNMMGVQQGNTFLYYDDYNFANDGDNDDDDDDDDDEECLPISPYGS